MPCAQRLLAGGRGRTAMRVRASNGVGKPVVPRPVTPGPDRSDLRAGAAPHSMPGAAIPPSAGRPLQTLPLIVAGAGQTPQFIAAAMREHLDALQHQAVATGIDPTTYARVRELLPGVKYHARARCLFIKSDDAALQRLPGTVGLAAGGPADAAALDLTKLLLQHLGAFVITKDGLSAADAPGLAAAAPALQVCDVVIAVAGADAGLPAAVASLVDAPVLAVPAPAAGAAAPSWAAPVAATAPDGGVAAALIAARMLRTAAARAVQIAESAAAAAAHAPVGDAVPAGAAPVQL